MARKLPTRFLENKNRQTRRRLFAERLEPRTVLCSVSCELNNGVLSVFGGDHDDAIELALRDNGSAIVVSGEGEEAGTFDVRQISRVQVYGSSGDDQLTIDAAFALPVEVDYSIEAVVRGSNTHSHVVGTITSALETAIVPDHLAVLPISEAFGSHHVADDLGEGEASASPIAHHHVGPSLASLPNVQSSDSHSHAASDIARSIASVGVAAAVLSAQSATHGTGHHATNTLKASDKISNDLTPKYCLTTPYTKVLITNVYRKPECFCDKEKTRTIGATANNSGEDSTSRNENAAPNAGRECLPCDRAAALRAMVIDDLCTEHDLDEVLENLACPIPASPPRVVSSESANDAAFANWEWLGEGTMADKLHRAGWIMIAASLVLLPQLLPREWNSEQDEVEFSGCQCVA